MRRARNWVAAAVLLAAVAVTVAAFVVLRRGDGSEGRPAARNGRLAFVSDRAPNAGGRIYAVDVLTKRRRLLPGDEGEESDFRVSPDRRNVAFVSNRSGPFAIWIMGLDGSRLRQVTNGLQGVFGIDPMYLDWSPTGHRIVFVRYGRNTRERLVTVDVATGAARQIAELAVDPRWSPDGSRIAYSRFRSYDDHTTVVIKPDGVPLWKQRGGSAAWSPDGRWLAIQRPNDQLAITTPAGDVVRLYRGQFVSWSPQGRWLAFYREVRSGGTRMFLANVAGGTRSLFADTGLITWSPDGRQLAFARTLRGKPATYVTRADDGRPVLIRAGATPGPWAPNGEALLVQAASGVYYQVASDGTRARRIIKEPPDSTVTLIGWSLGGRTILYHSRALGETDLFTARPDGSDVRRIIEDRLMVQDPSWSPDGRWIAFSRQEPEGDCHGCPSNIFVTNAAGTRIRQLTTRPNEGLPFAESADWSPDGRELVFVRTGPEASGILHVIGADGGRERSIQGGGNDARSPRWSPDGQRILFGRERGIWTVRPDGTELARVAATGETPVWSPDGSEIAFSAPDGLYRLNADGSGKRRIVATKATPGRAAWSPDGQWLVYSECRECGRGSARSHLYQVRVNGTKLGSVTTSPANDLAPAWQPRAVSTNASS